jgi:hypothetical protein
MDDVEELMELWCWCLCQVPEGGGNEVLWARGHMNAGSIRQPSKRANRETSRVTDMPQKVALVNRA